MPLEFFVDRLILCVGFATCFGVSTWLISRPYGVHVGDMDCCLDITGHVPSVCRRIEKFKSKQSSLLDGRRSM